MFSNQYPFTEIIVRTHHCTIFIITRSDQTTHLSFSSTNHHLAVKKIQAVTNNSIIQKEPLSSNPIISELEEYLVGHRQKFSLPSNPFFINFATPLQKLTWQLISAIPYGKTATYSEIALKLGNPSLARAVGQAAKANPLSLLVPCHRVTGKRSLGGYSGGATIKNYLLQLERKNR